MRECKCKVDSLEAGYEDGKLRMMVPDFIAETSSTVDVRRLIRFLEGVAAQMRIDQARPPEPLDPPLEGPVPASVVLSLDDPCPHPAREGIHEVYTGPKGEVAHCRACGARSP